MESRKEVKRQGRHERERERENIERRKRCRKRVCVKVRKGG